MENVTVIGAGKMGGALIKAIRKNKNYKVFVYDKSYSQSKKYESKNSIVWESIDEACMHGDIIILAVKPNIVIEVLKQIRESIKNKLVITIAAGIKTKEYEKAILGVNIIRCMPNMPAQVGAGMTTLCKGANITKTQLEAAINIFKCAGQTLVIDEKDMDGATALAGSAPAYVFLMAEAMADAGVLAGLKREDAYKLVYQTILGSAQLLIKTKKHPGQLKDDICSPGGTTIEAIKVLEEEGFRSSLIKAIDACTLKSKKLSGEK